MKALLSFLLIFFTFGLFAQTTIDHIEPLNWWVGMKDPAVQLMIHGNGLADCKAEIDYKGVKIREQKGLGSNYLFIDLNISKNTVPGSFPIVFKNKKQVVATVNYELKARAAGSADRKSFDNSDFFYLIMPDRFVNGDPLNDDMPGMLEKSDRSNPNGRHGGDIKGIINSLDYLKKMGVTTVWSTPLCENNMPAYSYHGYAITDLYKIDPRFGTNELYKTLVDSAHKKGMKIVMDMVFNHYGTGHWWTKDLPANDWVNQWPEFTRSNYRAAVVSDPYASKVDYDKMANGWFDITMADFNQRNKYVANYLIQNSIWWIEYAGLDGIRQDTYPYPDKDFMSAWMLRLNKEYPNFRVVGEAWLNNPAQLGYWMNNAGNNDGYNSHLTNVFDFPLTFAIQKAFNENEGWDTGLTRLYETLTMDVFYKNPMDMIVFADNHDIERMYPVLGSVENTKMALAFIATTRGIPLILYGTEALLDRGNLEGDPGKRKDLPGGWRGDVVNMFTGQNLSAGQKDVYDYITKVYNWRKTNQAVQTGKLTHYIPEDGIYVYFRTGDKGSVMVLMNNNREAKNVDTKRFSENLNKYRKGTDVITGETVKKLENINVPAKTVRIIELGK